MGALHTHQLAELARNIVQIKKYHTGRFITVFDPDLGNRIDLHFRSFPYEKISPVCTGGLQYVRMTLVGSLLLQNGAQILLGCLQYCRTPYRCHRFRDTAGLNKHESHLWYTPLVANPPLYIRCYYRNETLASGDWSRVRESRFQVRKAEEYLPILQLHVELIVISGNIVP